MEWKVKNMEIHGEMEDHEMEMVVRVWESWEKMEDEEDGHKVVKWLMKLEDIYMSV